jgi:hypothetical protein
MYTLTRSKRSNSILNFQESQTLIDGGKNDGSTALSIMRTQIGGTVKRRRCVSVPLINTSYHGLSPISKGQGINVRYRGNAPRLSFHAVKQKRKVDLREQSILAVSRIISQSYKRKTLSFPKT